MNEMESGKAPRLDRFPVECLKKGGMSVLEWLVRLLNLSFDMRVVPMDWRGACIVPLYKGKGDKYECRNSRGISLLSAVPPGDSGWTIGVDLLRNTSTVSGRSDPGGR